MVWCNCIDAFSLYSTYHDYCAGIVLCFGGGVLLSTVLLHMVREVRESIARATALAMLAGTEEYPFAELLIGLGITTHNIYINFVLSLETFTIQ